MTDTTTEHAALIERLDRFINDSHDGTKDDVLREAVQLVNESFTALRTSHSAGVRDGWMQAADELDTEVLRSNDESEADGYFLAASHLRRNAPQEAADEA